MRALSFEMTVLLLTLDSIYGYSWISSFEPTVLFLPQIELDVSVEAGVNLTDISRHLKGCAFETHPLDGWF